MLRRLVQVAYWLAWSFAAVMAVFAAFVFKAYLAAPDPDIQGRLMIACLAAAAAFAAWITGRALKYVVEGR